MCGILCGIFLPQILEGNRAEACGFASGLRCEPARWTGSSLLHSYNSGELPLILWTHWTNLQIITDLADEVDSSARPRKSTRAPTRYNGSSSLAPTQVVIPRNILVARGQVLPFHPDFVPTTRPLGDVATIRERRPGVWEIRSFAGELRREAFSA